MLAIKEVLLLLIAVVLHKSVEQLPNASSPTSKKYVRVAVEASSFNNIRTTNLGTQG